jgi:hypothetical protein
MTGTQSGVHTHTNRPRRPAAGLGRRSTAWDATDRRGGWRHRRRAADHGEIEPPRGPQQTTFQRREVKRTTAKIPRHVGAPEVPQLTRPGKTCAGLVMANRDTLQREIASLEQALGDAVKETDKAERALDELEGHRIEAEGRLAIARQAATNYAGRLEERRQALAHAIEVEVQARLLEAVGARDDTANRAAEAIAHLIASFERLDAARAETAERVEEAEPHLGRRAEVGPEPPELEQQWTRLIDFVSRRAELRLDDELIEAAASSPSGFEINKLPQELRVIARQRRRELLRRAIPTRNQRDS